MTALGARPDPADRARPVTAVLAAAAAFLIAGCAPSVNQLQVTVEAYISAVSLNDVARVLDLSAPYQRALEAADPSQAEAIARAWRGRVEEGYMAWDGAKSTGTLVFDPLGIAIIQGIGLGKEGAAAAPLSARFAEGGMRGVVTTRALTNYRSIRWGSIPTGGRIYLMGMPFGRVVNFATGYDDPSGFELLETVDLEWTLARMPGRRTPGAPFDWFVEGVVPIDGTATGWTPPAPAP